MHKGLSNMKSLKSWCEENHQEGLLLCYLEAGNLLPPDGVSCASDHPVRWKCRACGQLWETTPRTLVRRRSDRTLCPACARRRVTALYNLEAVCPEVADQWDYSKNGALTPRNVSPSSQKKVSWRCPFDPSHTWSDRISNRTQLLRGCPICSRRFHISYAARAVYYYLHRNGVPCGCEVPAGRYRIDIAIHPSAPGSPPIALELDGYRHRSPEAAARDARKDACLREQGYRVIRVREQPAQFPGVRVEQDSISYPYSNQHLYLNRMIQEALLLAAGIRAEPDHVRDHWKIESFYYHTRKERSLAVQYPELAREWSEQNQDRPDTVSPGLNSNRWWKCPACGREYPATVYNRTHNRSSCPFCAHLKVAPETSLAAVCPEVAAEWDFEKNAPLRPTDVLPGSDRRVWWRCGKGHSWKALIYTRTGPSPTKCPVCQGHTVVPETSLASRSPALARYWHPTKNDLTPEEVAPCSNRDFWWQCPRGHEWQDPPNRLQKYLPHRVCPYCDHRRLSAEYCLAAENPALAALWHPRKNTCTPDAVAPHSNGKVWWLCPRGHEWQDSVSRMQVFGAEKACPYCANRKVWHGNSLAGLAPELAKEWHPTKNLPLTPESVLAWSSKQVWWQCSKGHEWPARPHKRYRRGDGCPFCSGRRASPENTPPGGKAP